MDAPQPGESDQPSRRGTAAPSLRELARLDVADRARAVARLNVEFDHMELAEWHEGTATDLVLLDGDQPPVASLVQLAAEQGVRPVSETVSLIADFWPEDDGEEFRSAVRRWRAES